jgi:O-antigen/teichoic acid export membrane protein
MISRTPSRFLGNTVALVASTVLSTALTFAQMKILAGNLALTTFGLFASLRGLSLLVSMLAANGFPQLLVRFLPEHAAHHTRARAVRLSAISLVGTIALCLLQIGVLAAFSNRFFDQVPASESRQALLFWFSITTLGVALKLVVYGGFNGLRRFGSQTILEVASLAVQVGWMAIDAHSLTMVRLFEITGVASLGTALVALPWYARTLTRETAGDAPTTAPTSIVHYWWGAVGLSIVALAFTDVDRWILSNVLALEALSLFHVASRIARLANRFIAMPVLAFQPEATRVHAEGRRDVLDVAARTFFKASLLMAAFACVTIIVYGDTLIRLVSNDSFLGARTTLWLLAATIPLSAMTAPLTAIMKSLDGVRAALSCDLVWAGIYIGSMLVLAGRFGVVGAGIAQLAACTVQLVVAMRLATLRPRVADVFWALAKSLVCALVACVPAAVARRAGLPEAVVVALALPALWIYLRLARLLGVLRADERERLRGVIGRRATLVSGWMP